MTGKTRPGQGRPTPRGAAPLTHLHSVEAVAECFGVSTKTVRRLIAGGELKKHRIGSSVRVSEEDLRAYLARCR